MEIYFYSAATTVFGEYEEKYAIFSDIHFLYSRRTTDLPHAFLFQK